MSDNEVDHVSSKNLDDKTRSPIQNRLLQLPLARVKTIMKTSPDLLNVSQEAYFLVTRATELFVEYIAKEVHKVSADKKKLDYKLLSEIVADTECLEFLEEIVPKKIKMSEYWAKIGCIPEIEETKNKSRKTPLKENTNSPKVRNTTKKEDSKSPKVRKSPNVAVEAVKESIVID
ncbi:chromatin accessibility complex protein 1 isoform X1 [Hydra vulgaris]|uniref:Chromatin accessibility complex protein 1 n=1 Tax=Hydra vulgaris TaxID=6087 RepID=T2M5E6_HYDVU|nr:chromatin accessibility complex protein 1 [Hydra vulgaris]